MTTTKDIVKRLAKKATTEEHKTTQTEAKDVFDMVIECIAEAIVETGSAKLIGLGTFTVEEKPAHEARNPRTGETVHVSAKKVPKFKISASLKDAVNK